MELNIQACKTVMCLLPLIGVTSSRFLDDASNSDVAAVRLRLEEEKSKRLILQNDVEILMMKVEKLEAKSSKDATENARSMVSFNAKLSKSTTLDSHHIIAFDQVLENVGEDYSSNSGIFKARVSGLYLFSLTVLSNAKGKYAHIQLMRNGDEIGRAFAGSEATSWGQTGAVTVTTFVNVGDEVFAREFASHTGNVHGYAYCSFSGALLQTSD